MQKETQEEKVTRYYKLYRQYLESRGIDFVSPLSQEVFNYQQAKIDQLN